ncbi:MAG: peptide-N-glycosidase F-related protein [Bacteroidia bacterium]
MKTYFLLSLAISFACIAAAGPGDTIRVRSHENVHWDWNGNKDRIAVFPPPSQQFRQILLHYTLGCPSTGCSEWDYTTQIQVLRKTGKWDSTLALAPEFTADGQEIDTFHYRTDPTYVHFFNTKTGLTDSTLAEDWKVLLYQDPQNPLTPTDSFIAWEGDFYNYVFNINGDTVDSVWVPATSSLFLSHHKIYTPYEVKEAVELARVITPYAGNFDRNWQHTWTFDITDYEPLLLDSTEIRARYDGWQDGFTITLDFELIEGMAPRKVLAIQNLWQGAFQYGVASNPIESRLVEREVTIPAEAKGASVRILPSGHGFGGNENCAEFCPKDYYLKVNGQQRFSQLIWKDDCGLNPVYPQAGTWLYDRANWCPGGAAIAFDHEITPWMAPGSNMKLDMDLEPYSYNGSGSTPVYIIAAQLFTYGEITYENDATVSAIIAPTQDENHIRQNPVCANAIIEIQNLGSATLESVEIIYGPKGGHLDLYTWTGSLAFGEKAEVALPGRLFYTASQDVATFTAEVRNPNGKPDENDLNNKMESPFDVPEKLPETVVLWLKTNSAGNESSYRVTNYKGETLYQRSGMANNTIYKDTFNFPDAIGCYTLEIDDAGKDGLSFWANSAGTGYARLMKGSGSLGLLKNFDPDFGTQIRYSFTVGYTVDVQETERNTTFLQVFPNPTKERLFIDLVLPQKAPVHFELYNAAGQLKKQAQILDYQNQGIDLNIADYEQGIYLIRVRSGNNVWVKRVLKH